MTIITIDSQPWTRLPYPACESASHSICVHIERIGKTMQKARPSRVGRSPRGLPGAVRLIALGTALTLSATFVEPSPASAAYAAAAQLSLRTEQASTERARFTFGDDEGTTAKNAAPGGGDGALQNGASFATGSPWPKLNVTQKSLRVDGVDDVLTTPVVLSTNQSFTVATWVRMDDPKRAQTVLAQNGARGSAYTLKTNASGQWAFAMSRSDVDAPAWDTATGPAAVAGRWTHVAGVYDAAAGQLRLYVNGAKVATAAHTTTWAATGGLQAGRGLVAGKAAEALAGNFDEIHAWSAVVADEALADLVVTPSIAREDRCDIGHWLHAGGPKVKAIASAALAGIDQDRRVVYQTEGLVPHQLDEAADEDQSAYIALHQNQTVRYQAWEAVLDPYTYFGTDSVGFHTAPAYGDDVHKFLLQRNDQTWHDYLVPPVPPKPSQAALNRALAVAAEMRADGVPGAPADWQVKTWSANRIERLLRFGGFPTEAPAPDSLEFRTEVESIKINWSDCDTADPDGSTGVLADVTATAQREWNAELAAHAAPRSTIVAAEIQAMKDVRAASEAMIEAQGQAWVAGQLLKWQKYWLAQPKDTTGYPKAAEFTKANNDLTTAKNRINAQLTIAKNASTSAASQVTKVNTALQQATTIATSNGTPLYRGLAYTRQSAQVTKASAAAAQAAAKAIETTLNAAKAAGADGKALQALAATQQAAQQAEFRRAAAEEAAAQAKAAAQAAAARAAHAAEMATRAKNDRVKAEQAEAAAKVAADGAAQKREVAENERDVAAAARDRADAERAKANAAESRAQQDQSRASSALSGARQNEEIAGDRAADADEAEKRARVARDGAVKAEERRDALLARARALEAAAAAAEGTADAQEARAAANAARADANEATSAATSARNNANQATSAAVAARTAAIEADGAATRSRAAANGAQSDANTARSQAATARHAAADAIDAALAAAEDVKAAEVEAKKAQTAAITAAVNAVEARKQADIANASSARTAAEAWAAAQAATAATAAAVAAVKAGKEAISLGTPYRDTDASAGMAVLVGQKAMTLAQQQAEAAKIRAAEAAKAAAAAKELAAQANADAKAAAQAAAAAAEDAAKAMESVRQARVSTASAATDAAAARRASASADGYAQRAVSDASRANVAANTAASEAAAADAAATEAEKDAAAARAAADAAERDAATARSLASRADQEATAAEKDAADARGHADEADQAATRAEEEARRLEQQRRANALQAGSDAPGGGGTALTAEEEELLRKHCGQSCVDEYRRALADASKTVMQWIEENGVEVLLEVAGYNDLKKCFTKADIEACLWTLVNVASLLVVVGKLPAVTKAIVRVGNGITGFLEASAAGKKTLDRLRKVIDKLKKNPACKVGLARTFAASADKGCGTVNRNGLADHEFDQANEIVDELGGHFEGQIDGNTPGIDGHWNGKPTSLKTVQPGSVNNIRALANAMTNANKSAKKAEISDVVLFIKAPGMAKAEVETCLRAAEILELGTIVKISVRASDGWVHF
ncbi:hypothetical protein Pa4123_65840 [Phytohabitans aurantiacus]|uniref:LamG-like jellyroll fold domain-containing protein n=1 Tax=Phytohabitans aurantiacus TaxID=3016789 RepID=A0ABQ5R524_9ACTN|nr:hypothetical protein Pa4123_65840 [Phytohabitans aurantiacus]